MLLGSVQRVPPQPFQAIVKGHFCPPDSLGIVLGTIFKFEFKIIYLLSFLLFLYTKIVCFVIVLGDNMMVMNLESSGWAAIYTELSK